MKYSIIIPVYNSEKTIKRCVESLASQIRDDVEIIIVNDGSTDESERLCKELQTRYNNIVYIYKENNGVSSARNTGLSVAKGKYIMFVDGDDYVSEGCFDVFDTYTKSDADYYQFGFSILENKFVKEIRVYSKQSIDNPSQKEAFISKSVSIRSINSCLAKLYKRKIIEENDLRFYEGLNVGEDLCFVFEFLLLSKKIERRTEGIYFVDTDNEESLSRKYREDLSEQLICVYENMYKALMNSGLERELINRSLAWLHYRNAYSVVNDLTRSNLSSSERRNRLKAMCRLFNGKRVTPVGAKCKIIAIPIRLKLVGLVDAVFQLNKALKK